MCLVFFVLEDAQYIVGSRETARANEYHANARRT
jgi:hypothetical protein